MNVAVNTPSFNGNEKKYLMDCIETGWISSSGPYIDKFEKGFSNFVGKKYGIAVCNGTAALEAAVQALNIEKGTEVILPDFTIISCAQAIVKAGLIPVPIDCRRDTWNMDIAKIAEKITDKTRAIMIAHIYGLPVDMSPVLSLASKYNLLVIEDAAEAHGLTYNGRQCGSFGDYSAVSYNGNKIITGSSGGCLLTNSLEDANKARKWSTQARENAAWYQHEEVGYNYRMSNVIAGVVRGQYPYLEEHIAQKKAIYERYKEGLKGLPVKMNPIVEGTEPNYWLSALIIDKDAMCKQVRNDSEALYIKEAGKTCPTEILEAIASINAEGRPIWKPMHMQPMYRMHECVGRNGSIRCRTNAYIAGGAEDVGADIFDRGACLPSDNKMTEEQQERIIRVIRSCFE